MEKKNPSSDKMSVRHRIVYIAAGLLQGGAESILYRLVSATKDGWEVSVISLSDDGHYGEKLRALGVAVFCCDMPRGRVSVSGLKRLCHFVNLARPDVIQTWMYHADLLGGAVARLMGYRSVVWGVRASILGRGKAFYSACMAARLCAILSKMIPISIIFCSQESARLHQKRGYVKDKFIVIPNGYDCSRLRTNETARQQMRSTWGVLPEELLLGMVARWDPLKDHANLLNAFHRLAVERDNVRCVLVGEGMDESNSALVSLVRQHDVMGKVILAGPSDNITAVMNALDLHVLSSVGEAFPNVVAEAMACGTPCVVTNVGDAGLIVGNTGWVVPPSDPKALFQAMELALSKLSEEGGAFWGAASRSRILQSFSLEKMVSSYEDTWTKAMRGAN